MNKIEDFISKFKFIYFNELEAVFTRGNCYFFALILKEQFNGEICYLPIENHFICKIDNEYYDITGKRGFNEKVYKWAEYKDFDEKQYNRIVRDCINLETR